MPKDEDLGMLQQMAQKLGLSEEEGGKFIGDGMKRMGYRPRIDWDEPEEGNGGDEGGDSFSIRRERQQRQVGGGQQQQQQKQPYGYA